MLVKHGIALGLGVIALLTKANLLESAAYSEATLQGLDKVTARISTIRAPIGKLVRFGTLRVIVRHCDKKPPEEPAAAVEPIYQGDLPPW